MIMRILIGLIGIHMNKPVKKVCPDCDGSGQMEFDQYNLFDITAKPKKVYRKCKRCDGTGAFQERKIK